MWLGIPHKLGIAAFTELSGRCFTSFNNKNLPCAAPSAPSNTFPFGVDLLAALYTRKNLVWFPAGKSGASRRGRWPRDTKPTQGTGEAKLFFPEQTWSVSRAVRGHELSWRGSEQLHFSPSFIFHSSLEREDNVDPPAWLLLLLPTTNQYWQSAQSTWNVWEKFFCPFAEPVCSHYTEERGRSRCAHALRMDHSIFFPNNRGKGSSCDNLSIEES